MKHYSLARSGEAPLEFDGELVASVSGTSGRRAAVYLDTSGRAVLGVHDPGGKDQAVTARTLQELGSEMQRLVPGDIFPILAAGVAFVLGSVAAMLDHRGLLDRIPLLDGVRPPVVVDPRLN